MHKWGDQSIPIVTHGCVKDMERVKTGFNNVKIEKNALKCKNTFFHNFFGQSIWEHSKITSSFGGGVRPPLPLHKPESSFG